MESLFDLLTSFDDFCCLQGATTEQIDAAEQSLGLHFSPEYRDYLSRFGIASADGHEFTGLCVAPRLNVINVTEEERTKNSNTESDMYVLEKLYIDHVVIWQSSSGDIYETIEDSKPQKICSSFLSYLTL